MKTIHSKPDLTEVLSRLKIRLALANFKREHGYENYDLSTLETSLLLLKKKQSNNNSKNIISSKKTKTFHPYQQHHHHHYHHIHTPSKPYSKPETPICYRSPLFSYKLSAKRSTFIPSADEDAANLLVMLHHTA